MDGSAGQLNSMLACSKIGFAKGGGAIAGTRGSSLTNQQTRLLSKQLPSFQGPPSRYRRLDTDDQALLTFAWSDSSHLKTMISTRPLLESDCSLISAAFARQGWNKPASLYQRYLQEQLAGVRNVLVAVAGEAFVGYLTIQWSSDYASFRAKAIPEITDFNVLIPSRRKGYGTYLMDVAEDTISKRLPVAGIGVCLTPDYGTAQVLYVKRGYVPDGLGAMSHGSRLSYGNNVIVDDDLVLYLTKNLRK